MTLSILIVNWNTRDLLRACLKSLRVACRNVEHEVIVVDNASGDGSAEMVREEFAEVHLLASKENLGFAEGNNRAYEMAAGNWIWLLNPDTEVEQGAPERMMAYLEHHSSCGAVASALIDARDQRPQKSCRTFPTPGALWSEATGMARAYPRSKRYGFYRMGWWNYRDARPVEQPMASSFMMRRQAVESITGVKSAVGGAPRDGARKLRISSDEMSVISRGIEKSLFDPQFPIYFNDVDLCWRLWSAGWEIWYLPDAHVRHWGGAATSQIKPEMIAESHRSLEKFYKKHWQDRYHPVLYSATLHLVRLSGKWRVDRALRRRKAQSQSSSGGS